MLRPRQTKFRKVKKAVFEELKHVVLIHALVRLVYVLLNLGVLLLDKLSQHDELLLAV